ncbi:hypothetical protein BKA56DRAFT_620338 [Ilyonectria sp. MPI-CAGE-AT-0026]|nr:hypothetical protein BKA56DRAFT_620338 [Ilyonectria sp. MPI-CAGE-AT-0026]
MPSGTAVWLSAAKWTVDSDVLSVCYASFRADNLSDLGSQPSQKHWIAADEPWPAALLWHRMLTKTGDRFLANLTKGLETEEAGRAIGQPKSHTGRRVSNCLRK